MTELMNRFGRIKPENKSSICQEDLKYCEQQQSLYKSILDYYIIMYQELTQLKNKENGFYENIKADNKYQSYGTIYNTYFHSFFDKNLKNFSEIMVHVHDRFVNQIISYFQEKYKVSIKKQIYERYCHIEKPVEPIDCFHRTKEEGKQYKAAMKKHELECDPYLYQIINLVLHYNDILDDTFVLLDGFSFMEIVEQEIKDNSVNAAFISNSKPYYKIKKGKISFDGLIPSYKDCNGHYEIYLDDTGYNTILRAMSFFDSDKQITDIYNGWLVLYTGRYKTENYFIFGGHSLYGNHIKEFKYFKNGRWDVTFDSHTNALKFAKDYLGYVEASRFTHNHCAE